MTTHQTASIRTFAVTAPLTRALVIGSLAMAFMAAGQAKADIKIDGAHSRQEIAQACTTVGGTPFNTDGQSGAYGCLNTVKDTYIECSDKGECVGIAHKAPARYLTMASPTVFKNQVQFTMPQVQPTTQH